MKVSDLAVTEKPPAFPQSRSDETSTGQHPNEVSVPKLVIQDWVALVALDSEDSLVSQRPRSYSSDSDSTLTETKPIALTQYIETTCPHIAHSFYTRPLLLPGWSIEEVTRFSGWFTKKLKKDLEWEQYLYTTLCLIQNLPSNPRKTCSRSWTRSRMWYHLNWCFSTDFDTPFTFHHDDNLPRRDTDSQGTRYFGLADSFGRSRRRVQVLSGVRQYPWSSRQPNDFSTTLQSALR